MRKGFTLIELMIVIAIIAIIAAIAIPNLIQSRKSANEQAAASALKSFVTHETAWSTGDKDGNGEKDFWTLDVQGFFKIEQSSMNGQPVALIQRTVAQADYCPSNTAAVSDDGTAPDYLACTDTNVNLSTTPVPDKGYYFAAFVTNPAGNNYAQDVDGDTLAWENSTEYAFMAFPAKAGSTGDNAFIMNETNDVWEINALKADAVTNNTFNNTTTNMPNGTIGSGGTPPITQYPTDPKASGYAVR